MHGYCLYGTFTANTFAMVSAVMCFIHFKVKCLDLPGLRMLLLPSNWLLKMLRLLSACYLYRYHFGTSVNTFITVVLCSCIVSFPMAILQLAEPLAMIFPVVRLLVDGHLIFWKTLPVDISVDSRNFEMWGQCPPCLKNVRTQSSYMGTCTTIKEVLNSLSFLSVSQFVGRIKQTLLYGSL